MSSGKDDSIPVSLHQLPLRFVLDSLTRRQVRRRWWPLFLLKEKRGSERAFHLPKRRWIGVVAWLRNSYVIFSQMGCRQSQSRTTRLTWQSVIHLFCVRRREKDFAWFIRRMEAKEWWRRGHQLTHDDTTNDIRTQASTKGSKTLFTADSEKGVECMVICESLARSFGSIGTHPHQGDLSILSVGYSSVCRW